MSLDERRQDIERRDDMESVEVVEQKTLTTLKKRQFRNPEWESNIPLILYMFAIVIYGLITLYSASAPAGYVNSDLKTSAFYVLSQLRFTIFGIIVAIVLNFLPIDLFKNRFFMIASYGLSAFLIVLTSLFGIVRGHAKRWLKIGPVEFQSSEIFKVCLVIFLAIYRIVIIDLQDKGKLRARDPKRQPLVNAFFEFILPVGLVLVVDIIIGLQPHFSCFGIIGIITFIIFLVSGIRKESWIIGMGTFLLIGLTLLGVLFLIPGLKDKTIDKVNQNFAHVFKRIEIHNREEDQELTDEEKDEARQINSALDAIGNGGVKGLGIGQSTSKYSYVSELHNDYIFSIYVEETGFIGGTLLIIAYLLFIYMGMRVAYRAKDVFCRIIATGYTALIAVEALGNLAVELTVISPTGITLPFFSYGGTAQVLLLASYGMILCVARSGVVRKDVRRSRENA